MACPGDRHAFEKVYEIGSVSPVAYVCSNCGLHHMASQPAAQAMVERTQARAEAVEKSLPATPVQRLRLARERAKIRKDLLALRDELAE